FTRAGLPNQTLFPDATVALIHRHSHGIPRLINSLCDGALRTGFALQSPKITSAIVEEAAKDLDLAGSSEPSHLGVSDNIVPAALPEVPQPLPVGGHNGKNGSTVPNHQVPLESYASRQKSISFFSNLMDRWRH